jgi:T-complex protein 1 subunit eta
VGDGTTTVVILAGEFLRESKAFVEEGVHPQSIIRSFREAGSLAIQHIKEQAVTIGDKSEEEMRDLLRKCASTSLNSKLVYLLPPPRQTLCQYAIHV